MAERVDAIVVGGGVAGACAAYFLARAGLRDVLVLERDAVASGASGRASGLVALLTTAHPGIAAILQASAEFYARWEQEIGGAPALTRVGALRPTEADGRSALTSEVRIMQAAGHGVRLIERDELAALVPGWDLTGTDCAAYSPDSGFIDPPMVTTAIMNRFRALGGRVYQGAEVRGIMSEGGHVRGVIADRGRVEAPRVVLATGAWSTRLWRLVGLTLPAYPVRHQVLHLRPPADLPWPFPVCGDPQHGVYFRPEPGGLVLAANAGPDQPVEDPARFDTSVDPRYVPWITEHLARRIPAMREAGVVGAHVGIYLNSEDDFPVVGMIPGVEGLYCLCDTAGNGMTSSPGLARALVDTMLRGSTFTDLSPFRPGRFAAGEAIGVPYRHADGEGRDVWAWLAG